MLHIDENTSREDLLSAIYADLNIVQAFIDADKDPETMETADVRQFLTDWIEAGDECGGC